MIALCSLPVVVAIGGGYRIRSDLKSRQQARIDTANTEVREAVKGAEGWLKQDHPKFQEGENAEYRLMNAIAAKDVSEKADADAVLESVRTRRAEFVADLLFNSVKKKIDNKAIGEAVALLHQYAADPHATKKAEAEALLVDCDLATSDTGALQTLTAMSDEQFLRYQNTGIVDDHTFTHPILKLIRSFTIRRNLKAASQRREEKRIAEANRRKEENRIAEAARQESERLALAAAYASEGAVAARKQAAKDLVELVRTKLVGEWSWGEVLQGDFANGVKFAQDGTFFMLSAGSVICRGLWRLDEDATVRTTSDNPDLTHVIRMNTNADQISIEHNRKGFDIQLMSSVSSSRDIPKAGKTLVIVADVKGVLHFRVFESDGRIVADTNESRRTEKAIVIADLKKLLENLWPPHPLGKEEKEQVMPFVANIAGHPLRLTTSSNRVASRFKKIQPKGITVADIPGVWVLTPGDELASREITLLPNGRIDDPAGRNSWTLKGEILVLRWVDRRAPGGSWVDTCTLRWGPKGERLHYNGVNQRKVQIYGYKGNLPPWFEKRRQELLADKAHLDQVRGEIRARREWEEAHWAELHPPTPRGDGRVKWPDEPKPVVPQPRNSYDPMRGGTPQRPNP